MSTPALAPAKSGIYVCALLAAASLLWGWNYGLWDLEGPDEGRYVQVAKELSGRADWLRLTVNGEPYKEKPPLAFWMIAGAMKLGGGEVSAWTARLPSVLAGVLTVLLVFDIGRVRWSPRAGLFAGLVLMTAPLFARQTASARLDVLFTAWITLAAWAWISAPLAGMTKRLSPGRTAIFWIGLAGAFFTKGPLAFIALFGMLLGESWRSRSWSPWRSVRPLWGLPLLSALVAGWLASQHAIGGMGFVRELVSTGTLGRILHGSHENPAWYYAVTLLEDVFHPWLIFLVPALAALWRGRGQAMPGGLRPLLFWIGAVLLILHVSAGKRTQYLLPILPPMALVTAWYLDARVIDRPISRWAHRTVIALGALLAAAYAVVAGVAGKAEDSLWPYEFYLDEPHAALAATLGISAAGTAFMLLRRRSTGALVVALAVLTMGVEVFYAGVVNTGRNLRRSSWSFSRTIEGMLRPGETAIGALGRAENPAFHVYGHYNVVPLDPREEEFDWKRHAPRLLVARAEDERFIEQAGRLGGYHRLGSVDADDESMILLAAGDAPAAAGSVAASVPLRLAVAGDTGTARGEQRGIVRQMLAKHREHGLTAVLLLGDNLYGDEPFPTAFRERFIEPFEPLIREGVPFHAAIGNHDNEEGQRREGEIHAPLLRMGGRDHYSLSLGGGLVRLIVLNSESIRNDEAQVRWFGETLRAGSSQWTLVLLHRPLLASEIAEGPNERIYALLRPDLESPWGPDLVLSGHNHLYERRHPVAGVHHITTGSGGKLDDQETFPSDSGRAAGYNEARSFLSLAVYPDRIEGEAISETGEVVDRFTISPRPGPTGVPLPVTVPEEAFRPS